MTSVSGAFPVETSDQNVPCYMLGKSKKKLLLCIFRIHLNVEETKSLAYKLISTRLQRVTIPNKIGCLVKFEKFVCTIQT